jgi:hypothetical protein
MKRFEHIASLKAMIRQNQKDMLRMKELLAELDGHLEAKPKKDKGSPDRKKDAGQM